MGKPEPLRAVDVRPSPRPPRASLHAHAPAAPRVAPRPTTDGTVREVIPWAVVEARRARAPRPPQPCIVPASTEAPPPPAELWATLDACERVNDESPPSGIRVPEPQATVPHDAPPGDQAFEQAALDEPSPTSFRAYTVEELDVRLRQSRILSFTPPPPKPWTPVGRALLSLFDVTLDRLTNKTTSPWRALLDAPARALIEALREALSAPSTRKAMRVGAVAVAGLFVAMLLVLKVADATDDVSSARSARSTLSATPAAVTPDVTPAVEAADAPQPGEIAPAPPEPARNDMELEDDAPARVKRAPKAKPARRAAPTTRAASTPKSANKAVGQRVSIRTAPF
jgi:hypothetical protein